MTQDKDNPETLTTVSTHDTGQRQSRDTDNSEHTFAHLFRFLCCVVYCMLFVFVLCHVCSRLSVSLDCLRPVSCVLTVVSVKFWSLMFVVWRLTSGADVWSLKSNMWTPKFYDWRHDKYTFTCLFRRYILCNKMFFLKPFQLKNILLHIWHWGK
jgi:hypothetical protein